MRLGSLLSLFRGRSRLNPAVLNVVSDGPRRCQVEPLERRQLLAADATLGAVYHEDAGGRDEGTDLIQITFQGGEPNTQLTRLVIETDKLADGLTIGDTFFDTAPGGVGAFGSSAFVIVNKTGIDSVNVTVADGGTSLVLTFVGFDPGETLTFSIDVDEQGFLGPNAVAEGNEFEGSKLTATFAAPHFHDAVKSNIFFDAYDDNFAGSGLNLPQDDYTPPGNTPQPVLTAGAIVKTPQTPLPITISGTVFDDSNLNNNQDGGDNGIAGVPLALWRFDGSQYVNTGKTATTDAAGHYQFNDVLPGKYRVVEAQPNGYFSVGAKAGTVNGVTNGAVTGDDIISDIVLLGGQDSVHNNFAESRPATLSGRVYHDADNDGTFDVGETGIGGVTVEVQYLPSSGPQPNAFQVVTAADGTWSKTGLRAGNYLVRELQPAGYLDGLDSAGSAGGSAVNPGDLISGIFLGSAQVGQNYNFGEIVPSSIRGRVHADTNGNCELDPGESPLAAVTVFLLDAAGTRIASTITTAEGIYEFSGLPPGSYGVEEIQPAGYFDSEERVGSAGGVITANDKIQQITLTSGTTAIDYNFCEHLPVSVAGRVHADVNGNDSYDPGEQLLPGVTIFLLDAAGNRLQSTVTNAQGAYKFEGLAPGTYGVEEIQPAGYYDSGDHVGSAGGVLVGPDSIKQIVLTSGLNGVEYNFAENLPVSVSGRVHADTNGNCELDGDEQTIAGVTVHLLDVAGNRIATTTTNAQGIYKFEGLAPGTYGVEEVQPAGYYDSEELVGTAGGVVTSNDKIQQIVLTSGINATGYNFCEHLPVSVSGRVHADINGNCELDPGEQTIAGVVIHLLDAAGNRIATTTTNAQGIYKFEGLAPATYGVEEVQPAGYYDSEELVGTAGGVVTSNDKIQQIVLTSGINATGYNFCEHLPTSVSGRVHADINGNCELDPGEQTIAGVTVHLLDSAGNRIATTTTNAQGIYKFEGLAPGTYGVEEVQPAGYYDSGDMAGTAGGVITSNDRIEQIVLTSGLNATDYNFCEHLPTSISGRVHADADGDCEYDPGEALLSGVTVFLLDASGNRIQSTTTDAQGNYKFEGLAPGTYGVEEMTPGGYFDSGDNAGSAGGVLVGTDSIRQIVLTSGLNATDYNFCENLPVSISGLIHADTNGNCEYDPGETLLSNVTVYLLDSAGTRIASTISNAEGVYRFEGLPPGTYGVEEITPAGYYDSGDQVGSAGGVIVAPDSIRQIVLTTGQNATGYDFCEEVPVSISGVVYADDNNNGVRDPIESGIAGVTVTLLDAAGNSTGIVRTTDANGRYIFEGLAPGVYGVAEGQPAGYFDGKDSAGTAGGIAQNPGDRILSATLTSGLNATDYNFGELRPASLSGSVHADLDGDCVLDFGESPLQRITVHLLDAAGNRIRTTTTNAAGVYTFDNLAPGTYGLEEITPAGYVDSDETVGNLGGVISSNDHIMLITLGPGYVGVNYNFCEIPPGTISGFVFQDGPAITVADGEVLDVQSVRTGQRGTGDTPIAGVRLRLGDSTGLAVLDASGKPRIAVTNAQGFYEFKDLPPGRYTVIEEHPQLYTDGIDTPGTTGGIALNPGVQVLGLDIGPTTDAIARIPLGAGQTSVNNNFSEVIVRPETPINPFPTPRPTPPPALENNSGPIAQPGPTAPSAPTVIRQTERLLFGGGGLVVPYTWHLSVVDAGAPRDAEENTEQLAKLMPASITNAAWMSMRLNAGRWLIEGEQPGQVREFLFGTDNGIPITGDFNGDGVSEFGVFVDGQWFIDLNGNGVWDEEDLWAELGESGDTPITGDWDGDGKTDIGVFGPAWPGDVRAVKAEPGLPEAANSLTGRMKNMPPEPHVAAIGVREVQKSSRGQRREDVIDHVFHYGAGGDVPVTGDWNGDGIATIGTYRDGHWILDENGDGKITELDHTAEFGRPGDLPVVGDFNGDGVDDLGIFRDGVWYLDVNGNRRIDPQDRVVRMGQHGDRPVVGDWNGDGVDQVGVYQAGVATAETSTQPETRTVEILPSLTGE